MLPRAVSALAALTLLAAPAAAHAAKPDLTVAAAGRVPASVGAGTTLTLAATVTVKGRAPKSTVGLVLSRDAKRDARDTRLAGGRTVPAHKRRSAGAVTVTVPAGTAAGSYRLLACADIAGKVRERNERNNCRAAKGTLTVTRASGGVTRPGAGGGGDSSHAPVPSAVATTPRPRAIAPALDSAHAVTQTVPATGGTLNATGADGSTFSLVIPDGALVSATAITLTPLTGAGGLPFSGGLGAGVDLKPEGLQLLKPAKLTLTPAHAIPVANQIAFGYHGAGEELHLELLEKGAPIALALSHFSGYGVASGTSADVAAQQAYTPTRSLEQIQQAIAEILREQRAAELEGRTGPSLDAIVPLVKEAYRDIVKPRMVAATTDDSIAISAIGLGLGWQRSVQLAGLADHDAELSAMLAEIHPLVEQIIRNAFDRTYQRCVDGDVNMAPRILAIERSAQLIGLQLGGTDKLAACLSFELDLSGSWTETDEGFFVKTASVQAQAIPLTLGNGINGPLTIRGSGPVNYTGWTIENGPYADGCTIVPDGTDPGTIVVTSLDLTFHLRTEMTPDGREILISEPPGIEMRFSPGSAMEHAIFGDCGESSGTGRTTELIYAGGFADLHAADETPYGWVLRDWNAGAGGAFAQLHSQLGNGYQAENATFTLRHAPQG